MRVPDAPVDPPWLGPLTLAGGLSQRKMASRRI